MLVQTMQFFVDMVTNYCKNLQELIEQSGFAEELIFLWKPDRSIIVYATYRICNMAAFT